MPNHKKTLEQKRKADERKFAPTYVFSGNAVLKNNEEHVDTIKLVQHDIRKTALISLAIVCLQLLFYFLLHNHVLAIGFVRY